MLKLIMVVLWLCSVRFDVKFVFVVVLFMLFLFEVIMMIFVIYLIFCVC